MRLDDLMVKYGTDKGSTEHDYGPIYEDHFRSLQMERITLLELGIWKGDSLRTWREYFPWAAIVGVDKVDRKVRIDGVQTHICDQTDFAGLRSVANLYSPLDIIIDDASHISSKTIASFKILWPFLAPGGIYVIEDLQTAYDPVNYGADEATSIPGADVDWLKPTAMQFCKGLADEVNAGLYPEQYRLGYDIDRVTFGLNICFITKSDHADHVHTVI